MLAFVFPGQGSQQVGMGLDLYNNFPTAKALMDKANEVLGFDILKLMFEGPAETLTQTQNAQPALYIVGYVAATILKHQGINPDVVAGHSLGEFTAYAASGRITYEDGLKLVRRRGELMAEADPEQKGTMAAIIGLDDNTVIEIVDSLKDKGIIVAANFNCPGQVVISGEKELVHKAMDMAKEKGAKLAKELQVSGAFHSPLVSQAAAGLEDFLKQIEITSSDIPLIANVTGQSVNQGEERNLLVKQLTSPVLWTKSVNTMLNMGVDTFVELGPGKVLQGLIKRVNRRANVFGVSDSKSLKSFVESLKS